MTNLVEDQKKKVKGHQFNIKNFFKVKFYHSNKKLSRKNNKLVSHFTKGNAVALSKSNMIKYFRPSSSYLFNQRFIYFAQ